MLVNFSKIDVQTMEWAEDFAVMVGAKITGKNKYRSLT